jgi:hypothetical protein
MKETGEQGGRIRDEGRGMRDEIKATLLPSSLIPPPSSLLFNALPNL